MKKLLTILLSVLCLFSIVGVNVRAASVETVTIEKIDVYGVDIDAKNTLSTFNNLKYLCTYSEIDKQDPSDYGIVRDGSACFYLYADKFEKVKEVNELSNYIVHDNTLEYGTKYYFVVSLLPNTDGGFVASDNIEVDISVNGKDTPIKASPISSLIENGEKKKADISSLTDKKQSRIMFYIPFETISDQKSVTLKYSVGEEYEWIITNNVGDDVTNKEIWVGKNVPPKENTEVNVKVSKLNLAANNMLKISVESKYGYNMVPDGVVGNQARYQITHETAEGESWEANNVVLLTDKQITEGDDPVVSKGIFNWIDETGNIVDAPTRAGNYEDILTFTAKIKGPEKGDLIYLDNDGDGKASNPYRIVKGNESNAEVLSLTQWSNESYMYFDDEINEFHYSNSIVDGVLDKFYIELPEQMQNAIKDKTFNVYSYRGIDFSEEHMSTANINDSKLLEESITRKVYALDVVDIEEYFDYKGFTKEDLLAFSNVTMPSEDFGNDFWLRSGNRGQVYEYQNQRAYFIYGLVTDARVWDCWQDQAHNVNPAFTIDLSKVHYTFAPEE